MSKFNFSFLKGMSRNNILVLVAIVAIIITGGLIYTNYNPVSIGGFSLSGILGKSSDQIGKDVVDYINNNQLSETTATLVSVSTESGLVKVKIKIGENEFDSYATKDGKLLFPQAINMAPKKETSGDPKTPANSGATVTKNDKPTLEAFVVAACPYGLQMQRAIVDAVANVPSMATNIVVRYIGSITNGKVNAMHDSDASGKAVSNGPEAQENLRQICLREEQPAKYWGYVSCYMKKATDKLPNGMPLGDTTGCLASTGVDTAKLNACVSDASRGLAYAKVDFDLNSKYNVSGSPTVVLNGTTVNASRSSDGVKSALCSGFNAEPEYCATKLNTASAAASFSTTYASTSGSGSAATCN